MLSETYLQRFSSLKRLYGEIGFQRLSQLHICIIGLGGVGSWAVEALARTGIGRLTLIDYDTISLSNINRQLPALGSTEHQKKFDVLKQRVLDINPDCQCITIDDFVTLDNLTALINKEQQFDYVIDACDSIRVKAALIAHCKRNKIKVITTGGAGGLTDPTQIQTIDLSKTFNDPLASKVRSTLRSQYGFAKHGTKTFGVPCVFSSQAPVYPADDGSVCNQKPGLHGVSLDCRFGYGSVSFVTASFGFAAAAYIVNKLTAANKG